MVERHIDVLAEDQEATVQALLQYPSATPHLNAFGLVIADDGKGCGRGVQATRLLAENTVIEISPVLLFPPGEYDKYGKHTQLDGYTFVWKKTTGGKAVMALALGLGSLFNHSSRPNVTYTLDLQTHSIHYRTIRAIEQGEELFISYGAGKMWWEAPLSVEAQEREDKERLNATDPSAELSRFADIRLSDESDDETVGSNVRNGVEVVSKAGPSEPHTLPAGSAMYRVTAAKDPSTLPLSTRQAWVIDIEPQKASSAIKFVQCRPNELQNRDDGLHSTRHLRSFKTKTSAEVDSDGKKGRPKTSFLICLQEAMPDRRALIEMLSSAQACFGPRPDPYLSPVPRAPAPTRERLAEWQSVWPCLVNSAVSNNAPAAALSAGTWKLDMGGGQSVSVVDRKADEALWDNDLRLQWAVNRFKRCVALARHALARVEQSDTNGAIKAICSAVHVTHPFDQAETFLSDSSRSKWSWREREERGCWANLIGKDAPMVGRVAGTDTQEELSSLHHPENAWKAHSQGKTSLYTSPVPGIGIIEVDAVDQRIAKRNPLKHAVVEAISRVSILRAIDRAASTPSPTAEAGNDYLLTGLVMFCLYEPCVYCTMALLHSRVKEVYFLFPSPGSGGCCGAQLLDLAKCDAAGDGGIYALQEQKGLNHAFTVWRWMHPTLSHPLRAGSTDEDILALRRQLNIGSIDP